MGPDYLNINRDIWNADAPNWVDLARERWQSDTPVWGNWANPEAELKMLPDDMAGQSAVELGCGTGYVAFWMHQRGAKVTAIDLSAKQLATARALAEEFQADITFIEGDAETTGLSGDGFDFAISEYGASIWCRPQAWLQEAWRLLKPGGAAGVYWQSPFVVDLFAA